MTETAQALFDWIRSGLGSNEYAVSGFHSGFMLAPHGHVSIPKLCFFLPGCDSIFTNHVTSTLPYDEDGSFAIDSRLEMFTFSPDLEIKRLLRRWNTHRKQTLVGMHSSTAGCSFNTTSRIPNTETNESIVRLLPLEEKQVNDYLRVQEVSNEHAELITNQHIQKQHLQSILFRLVHPLVHQFLILSGNELIGVVATIELPATSENHLSSTPTLGIFDFAIIPEYQGRGFGKKVIQHFLRLAHEDKSKLLILAVEERVSFYQELGFEETTRIHRWTNY